jgi:hypothetical protein
MCYNGIATTSTYPILINNARDWFLGGPRYTVKIIIGSYAATFTTYMLVDGPVNTMLFFILSRSYLYTFPSHP